ncbi:MAG: AraC family transcriptional regulator [Pseudomonadota bacterium]
MFDAPLLPADDLLSATTMFHAAGVEEYTDLAQTTSAMVPMEDPTGDFAFVGHEWIAGSCYFCENKVLPQTYQVEKRHLQNLEHLFYAQRVLEGGEHAISEDEISCIAPNQIDLRWHVGLESGVIQRSHFQEVYMPKEFFEDGVDLQRNPQPFYAYSTLTRMIFSEWDALFTDLSKTSTLSGSALDRFIACIKIALGTPAQREDVRAQAREALQREICRYIERNLGHPDLTASSILRDFGVSRAGLYRMFEPQGGVRHYITERRAIRAVLELSQGVQTRGAVQAAADRWGFSTGPNFNRVIKRMFGAAPGALFQTAPRTRHAPRGGQDLLSNYLAATAAA